jgi:hypothetical protein
MWTYQSYLEIVKEGMDAGCTFFLRHDVDVSLKKAVELAEIEADKNLHSTYYILLTSPFYNALSDSNIQRIQTIRELGMGIGLHYDPSLNKQGNERIVSDIVMQTRLLENYVGELNGISVTFHKPVMGKEVDMELIEMNYDMVHLNTHPIWYSHVGLEMEECLHDLELDKDGDKLIQKEINDIRKYREMLL